MKFVAYSVNTPTYHIDLDLNREELEALYVLMSYTDTVPDNIEEMFKKGVVPIYSEGMNFEYMKPRMAKVMADLYKVFKKLI